VHKEPALFQVAEVVELVALLERLLVEAAQSFELLPTEVCFQGGVGVRQKGVIRLGHHRVNHLHDQLLGARGSCMFGVGGGSVDGEQDEGESPRGGARQTLARVHGDFSESCGIGSVTKKPATCQPSMAKVQTASSPWSSKSILKSQLMV
jgi:hypothetical protein